MQPRLTMALPVYNGEQFITDAILSILAQDYKEFKLVILDNASTDATGEICRKFAAVDTRIEYILNERNIGVFNNFNKCFQFGFSEFFKWCAHDDCLSKNYIGACISALDANQNAVVAYGSVRHIDAQGRILLEHGGKKLPKIENSKAALRFRAAVRNAFWTIDQELFGVFRGAALKRSTLWRSYHGSDHALIKEMALLGPFIHVPDIIFYNREHPNRGCRIATPQARMRLANPDEQSQHAFESWMHLMHLIEITFKHRRVASPLSTLPCVIGWAFTPRQFSRCALELVSTFLPPSGENWIRNLIRTALLARYPTLSFEATDELFALAKDFDSIPFENQMPRIGNANNAE
jgi:glycosyltransferase involved in cell wall biosynthesis